MDLGFDDDLEDVEAAIAADERERRDASRALPTPEVGSDGGPWRLADGGRLQGEVTGVEGRTVHGRHVADCRRCSGRGGSASWPGHTCYRCAGRKVETRTVRLYAPHQVEAIADAKVRRREAIRQGHLARAAERRSRCRDDLAATLVEHAPLIELIERTGAVRRNRTVSDIVAGMHEFGTLSERQASYLRRACAELVELDDQRRTSRPFGVAGERHDLELTCQRIRRFTASNPATYRLDDVYLVTYRGTSGAVFLSRLRQPPAHAEGDVVLLRGTVRDHREHEGVMQTTLLRAKVLKVVRTTTMEQAIAAAEMEAGHENDEGHHAPSP